MKRICLWSGPRNISTALMYSFAQRPDTLVVDEPLYAHYLLKSKADHPGYEEIISGMETDGETVVKDIILGKYESEIIFFKQMTHHLIDIDESFLTKVINIFLIRNPARVINSFSKIIPDVSLKDIGIHRQYELFCKLRDYEQEPVVIDSSEILKNPSVVLNKLCNKLGITFYEDMLKWNPGPRPEDGIWAKYWYENVHKSEGFVLDGSDNNELSGKHLKVYEKAMPFYEKLFFHSIKS